jgi:peptidoglycan/LPS O-acetylase OafA/YrhL
LRLHFPLGYRPALDGLRAIAVMPVLAFHAGVPGFSWGWIGVDLFFVISGFLITSILLIERAANGRFLLLDFYRRRALRLLPALVMLGAVFTSYAVIVGRAAILPRELIPVIFYVSNWTRALYPISQGFPRYFGHCWSLAIEEQFYMIWPIALIVLLRISGRPWTIVLATVAAIGLWRAGAALIGFDATRIYNGTDTRADALLIGAAMALSPPHVTAKLIGMARYLWLPMLAAVILIAEKFNWSGSVLAFGGFSMIAAAFTLVLLATLAKRGLFVALLSIGPMVWIGRRSYGLYLWHFPIFAVALFDFHIQSGTPLMIALVFGGAVGCATLSYRFIEVPFLAMRYSRHEPEAMNNAGAAGLIRPRGTAPTANCH